VASSSLSRRHCLGGLALGVLCFARAALGFAAEPNQEREEVSVFAAASLADALAEIGAAWEAAGGSHLVFNFGASSDLARQIRAGAPADVFVSADAAQMDALEREGLVRAADRSDLLSNALVVVVPRASAARVAVPRDLTAFATIALADPQLVPAGVYARAWLEGIGLWDQLRPRVVPTLHVRAALAAVESENVAAGIVYRTDAARSTRARIAFEVPPSQGPPIRYPVAPLATSGKRGAGAFVAYLRSPAARAVFVRHGFLVLGGQ
jgi:molybdate transport system substrate-binding protein